jgi:hypothetical protein
MDDGRLKKKPTHAASFVILSEGYSPFMLAHLFVFISPNDLIGRAALAIRLFTPLHVLYSIFLFTLL